MSCRTQSLSGKKAGNDHHPEAFIPVWMPVFGTYFSIVGQDRVLPNHKECKRGLIFLGFCFQKYSNILKAFSEGLVSKTQSFYDRRSPAFSVEALRHKKKPPAFFLRSNIWIRMRIGGNSDQKISAIPHFDVGMTRFSHARPRWRSGKEAVEGHWYMKKGSFQAS